jgi:L-alanine-DL-glutamate epimerase-like enolase superfamily enzyme
MRIVNVRECAVPVGAAMRNASIGFETMTASALAIVVEHDGVRLEGFSFDSIGRYAKGGLLRERFIPRLIAAEPGKLLDASGLLEPEAWVRAAMANEKEGGHGERPGAVALIEAAAWDLRAKQQGFPLWKSIAGRYGNRDAGPRIKAYASCGHYRPGEEDALALEVRSALDAGYRCVKIKLSGWDLRDDLRRLESASAVLRGASLAVDLNGRLPADRARAWFSAVAPFKLAWIEEPAPPLDYKLLAHYAGLASAPLATGENLFSLDDARNLLRYGGLWPERDLIQIDPLLAYGVGEYVRILELFESGPEGPSWPRRAFMPHAGHLFAAHCVAGLGLGMAEVAPDSGLPYGGLWSGVRVLDGTITLPELPGVGFEAKPNLFALLAPLAADS